MVVTTYDDNLDEEFLEIFGGMFKYDVYVL